ncbi:alpha/beta fold hydrolase [Vagococcus entomophilus]|nr:alpha/beta hydrolase [Vagococcus entomophilus]
MKRHYFQSETLTLSYLDNEQVGKPIIVCLHGLFGSATYFSTLLNLKEFHVFSLDQRGHGFSDHASSQAYTIQHFVQDFYAFYKQVVKTQEFVVVGHSLGGIVAYHAAAVCPDIKKIILEDIGAIEKDDCSFAAELDRSFLTLQQLNDKLAQFHLKDSVYFLERTTQKEEGWCFQFDAKHAQKIQHNLNGNHWETLLKSSCPILLLHGKKSWVISNEHALEIEKKRPHTKTIVLEEATHTINLDAPNLYLQHILAFLK